MNDWERLSALYDELSRMPVSRRAIRLESIAADEPDLARELGELLDAAREEHGPIERVAEQSPIVRNDLSGRELGPYTLIEPIGAGGMGVVYRARRTDDSFEREVAVKFLADGPWRPERVEAFLRERRILASLDHPNIARLLDAATLPDVGPYVIMELVEGLPIDASCDARRLDVRDRLRLFRKVCLAVQAAHRQLIVHRDIKPSNILVAADGEPKLLDFGIAKLLEPDGSEGEKSATRAMTPAFASPEQIEGRGITTATDVWALGLVLHRMLAGRTPFGLSDEAPSFEHQRAVLESDPISATRAAIEAGRPREHVRALRGDVDNILAKALERDPARRYGTAAEFAADIERHLDGLPVSARAASASYRLGKFARRHALALLVLAAVILALAGAAATTWRQARIAEAARVEAEAQSDAMHALTQSLLFDIHEQLVGIHGTTAVRASLIETASEHLATLRGRAPDDLQLAESLVVSYERLGDLRGNPAADNRGDREGARASFLEGVAFCDELGALTIETASLARACLRIRKRYAFMEYTASRLDEATRAMQDGVAEGRLLVERYPEDPRIRSELADSLALLGEIHTWNSRSEEGIALLREAATAYEALLDTPLAAYETTKGLASTLSLLGAELVFLERFEEAFPPHRRAIELARADFEAAPDRRGRLRNYWYQLTFFTNSLIDGGGDPDEIVESATKTLAFARRMRSDDPESDMTRQDLSTSVRYYARAMLAAGRPADAIPAFEEAIELYRADVERDPRSYRRVALARQGLAEAYVAMDHRAEACASYSLALAIWDELAASDALQPADSDWPGKTRDARAALRCNRRASP